MPINKDVLIRYKTIDKCLQNRNRAWTLDDLIEACSATVKANDEKHKGVSKRTVQADIQAMRSKYSAPIVVRENKFYTYDEPEFSITSIPLPDHELNKLGEVIEMLKQFREFAQFDDSSLMILKLEDQFLAAKKNQPEVLHNEKNNRLPGMENIGFISQAIRRTQVLDVWHQSYKAKRPGKITLCPYLLKEYRNRWYLTGKKLREDTIVNLALDRIKDIDINPKEKFSVHPDFDPTTFFKDVIGVTVTRTRPVNVHLLFDREQAPFVLTRPLHHSQKLVKETEGGVEINLKVKLNPELEREILAFGAGVKVLAPERLRKNISNRLEKAAELYKTH